jgi:hypothetical protein
MQFRMYHYYFIFFSLIFGNILVMFERLCGLYPHFTFTSQRRHYEIFRLTVWPTFLHIPRELVQCYLYPFLSC